MLKRFVFNVIVWLSMAVSVLAGGIWGGGVSGGGSDATITFSDITTNNSSTSMHGFLPKLDNVGTHYLSGTGVWQAASGGVSQLAVGSGTATPTAAGAGGIALGVNGIGSTTASGADSIAIGTGAGTTQSGNIVMGKNVTSTGVNSVLIGGVASSTNNTTQVGYNANGNSYGAALGASADGSSSGVAVGYNANGSSSGVAVGNSANGSSYGTAVGNSAGGSNYGAAVGSSASASSFGAALGYNANANNYGVAVGYNANANNYGVALGTNSITIRYGELSVTGDHISSNKKPWGLVQLIGQTTNATQTEIFLHGVSTNRILIASESTLRFEAVIIAKQPSTSNIATWTCKGMALNSSGVYTVILDTSNPIACASSGTTTGWSLTFTNANSALSCLVTGANSTTINWHVSVQLTELKD